MVEIERTNERSTFLMTSQSLNYYIIVPLVKNVKILLGLMENIDNQKIKEIPTLNDKVVVVPVLNQQMIDYLKNTKDSYTGDSLKYFAGLINNVVGLLKHNGKEVDPVVLFNNNEQFNNFINYFASKIPNRIQISSQNLLKKELPSISLESDKTTQITLNNNTADTMNYPKDDVYQMTENLQETQTKKLTKTKKSEPGFVSYVLLGVLVAVMTLVLLYMLI